MTKAKQAICVITGALVFVGAVAMWHYWKMDGFLAFIAGAVGLCMIQNGVYAK